MLPPQIPHNEAARLRELYAYNLLDTASEQIFEEIAELAAVICGTRFAALTLIDSDRQWVKCSHGIEFQPFTRNQSICGHAILESDVFEVPNIANDARFYDNPLLTGHPRFRFYAGSQLRSDEGYAIGMLCVLDSEPGELSEIQREALTQLSRLVMAILDARRKSAVSPPWLGGWLNNVSQEVYVRDPKSLRYLFANNAALQRARCTLAQLQDGTHSTELEGDDREFSTYLKRFNQGESSVAFESTRPKVGGGTQRIAVCWSILSTPDSIAILSIVREL